MFSCSDERTTKVGLQPFNNFDQALTDSISRALEKTYGLKTYILKTTNIPKEAFINIKSPRYRADKLIAILKNQVPDSLDYIVGMTSEDISVTKRSETGEIKEPASKYEDWGVFGLGYRPGPSCVVSTFRLNNKGREVLIQRLKKVAIHELGHNMGLDHCKSDSCVMKDAAETIKTIDFVDSQLCGECKKRILN